MTTLDGEALDRALAEALGEPLLQTERGPCSRCTYDEWEHHGCWDCDYHSHSDEVDGISTGDGVIHAVDWDGDKLVACTYVPSYVRTYYVGPDYHEDLNALRDGPEQVLRERGWSLIVTDFVTDGQRLWSARWFTALAELVRYTGRTEAEARARAALAALQIGV